MKNAPAQTSKSKLLIIIFVPLALIALAVVAAVAFLRAPFALSPENYTTAALEPIDLDQLNQLISEEKSFGLFISQAGCQASNDLRQHLETFTTSHTLKFYEISFSALKDQGIIPDLKFYPSFALFRRGQVVDFLEADSNEGSPAYSSVAGFSDWFTHYAKLDI